MSGEGHSYHDNVCVVSMTQSLTWCWGTVVASGQKCSRRKNPGRLEIRAPTSAGKQRFCFQSYFLGEVYFGFFVGFSFQCLVWRKLLPRAWAMLFLKWQLTPTAVAPRLQEKAKLPGFQLDVFPGFPLSRTLLSHDACCRICWQHHHHCWITSML